MTAKPLAAAALVFAATAVPALEKDGLAHGFKVRDVREIADIGARLWRLDHLKTGAELVWIERDDDNKAFAVAFKTLPTADDGVAHILEHSVLCGSGKYPVKEPFVELLKSSVATYINASTGPDLTVYPVASRNDRDLLNLADVYLDAVFDPDAMRAEWAFLQERNIVWSEMKGAMANPDRRARRELDRLLFPDTVYRFNAGGDPAVIPSLAYGRYRDFYRRHYHPSNARIYLYGRLSPEPFLEKIDAAVAGFDLRHVAAEIAVQPPVSGSATVEYPSAELHDRVLVRDGWVFGSFRDREEVEALSLALDVLSDGNASPLGKALVGAGLCDSVALWCENGFQNTVSLSLRNVRDGKADECRRVFRETLRRELEKGIDRAALAAKIDRLEFRRREMDSSSLGLEFLWTSLESWLYGGDPRRPLEYSSTVAALRSKLGTGHYEGLVRRRLLDNPHRAELTMLPSAGPAAAVPAPEKGPGAPADRPEDLAKLPRLRLADIPEKVRFPTWTESRSDGVTVLSPAVPTNGVVHLQLAFPVAPEDADVLDLPLLGELLGEIGTARRDTLGLRREVSSRLGSFSSRGVASERGTWYVVTASFLESRTDSALELLREILFETRLDDGRQVAEIRRQLTLALERGAVNRGDRFAGLRAAASLSGRRRALELLGGYSQYVHLRDGATGDLKALARRLFVKDGLVINVDGTRRDAIVAAVVAALPAGAARSAGAPSASVRADEAVEIPGDTAYTAFVGRLPSGVAFSGAFAVACEMLSLDYLWEEVRVKGGAYGGRVGISRDGAVTFGSWRDPSPARTFDVFRRAGGVLRAWAAGGRDFEKFQVSALGANEPCLTPAGEARRALEMYLDGRTAVDSQRVRDEIRATTAADLVRFADALDAVAAEGVRSAVGGKAALGGCSFAKTLRLGRDGTH